VPPASVLAPIDAALAQLWALAQACFSARTQQILALISTASKSKSPESGSCYLRSISSLLS
jgi:hypothetical protein